MGTSVKYRGIISMSARGGGVGVSRRSPRNLEKNQRIYFLLTIFTFYGGLFHQVGGLFYGGIFHHVGLFFFLTGAFLAIPPFQKCLRTSMIARYLQHWYCNASLIDSFKVYMSLHVSACQHVNSFHKLQMVYRQQGRTSRNLWNLELL